MVVVVVVLVVVELVMVVLVDVGFGGSSPHAYKHIEITSFKKVIYNCELLRCMLVQMVL